MEKKPKKGNIGRPAIGQRRSIQVSDRDWEKWAAAAKKAGIPRAEWIREICNHAAKKRSQSDQ